MDLRHPLCALERLVSRFRRPIPVTAEALRRHVEADARGEDTYTDPISGRLVFTEAYHRRRGACCGNGCRHCAWREGRARHRDE